ncbi:hypothetical protein CDAR_226661 [Caerostris darwini]|uniref:Uncharacterized protein n=1 Tax=Caerostris darwini TaxID=1538125 RepID=A0AAV4TWI2_9ARAC|nr:hypothetical protein CDAR_226661 [Caerostris darwini]
MNHVIIELGEDISKKVLSGIRIFIDFHSYRVKIFYELPSCFKCQKLATQVTIAKTQKDVESEAITTKQRTAQANPKNCIKCVQSNRPKPENKSINRR